MLVSRVFEPKMLLHNSLESNYFLAAFAEIVCGDWAKYFFFRLALLIIFPARRRSILKQKAYFFFLIFIPWRRTVVTR